MIILSLIEPSLTAMRAAIRRPPRGADLLEVRLDAISGLEPDQVRVLFREAPKPLIATCRRRRDGGLYRGGEAHRRRMLAASAAAGAAYVDVEDDFDPKALGVILDGHPGVDLIVSHHDVQGFPRNVAGLYRRMSRLPRVRAVKLIATARHPGDMIRMRNFLEEKRGSTPPVIGFCMGTAGILSRLLALEWGSWATFASAAKGKETAPGQVSLEEMSDLYRMDLIDDATKFTGIIGSPLGHSLSSAMHNAVYAAREMDYRYVPLEVPPGARLGDLRSWMRNLRLRGVSVTAPHKVRIVRHLDLLEPLAERIGAVNTILLDDRRLVGFNTDATGGWQVLSERMEKLRIEPAASVIAIVGAGGSARAMAHAAACSGARIIVASRTEAPGRKLARAVGGTFVAPRRLRGQRYDVLVNCTPAGTSGGPLEGKLPMPAAAIKGALVFDLVYNPETTPLIAEARKRGLNTLGGLEMLVRQAQEQHTLFTGRTPPDGVMRRAATGALSGR